MKVLKEPYLTFNDVLLVPQQSKVSSRKLVNTSTRITSKIQLQIPIISANMDTVTESYMAIAMARNGGLGVIHRFLTIKEQVVQVEVVKKCNLIVGAAIGASVGGDYLDRAQALLDSGADLLVVDVAHGHAQHVFNAVVDIKNKFPECQLMVGNVATLEGVLAFQDLGADCVKIGIGPGTACSTRVVTGCGVPQLSAILNCADYSVGRVRIPVIADGGIKTSGDIVKALAAGASAVMLGSLLAGADEAPGEYDPNSYDEVGPTRKIYRGMASVAATQTKLEKESVATIDRTIVPEGVVTSVPFTGPVRGTLEQLVGGLRSGMSYCNASNLRELRDNAVFAPITSASWIESLPITAI